MRLTRARLARVASWLDALAILVLLGAAAYNFAHITAGGDIAGRLVPVFSIPHPPTFTLFVVLPLYYIIHGSYLAIFAQEHSASLKRRQRPRGRLSRFAKPQYLTSEYHRKVGRLYLLVGAVMLAMFALSGLLRALLPSPS